MPVYARPWAGIGGAGGQYGAGGPGSIGPVAAQPTVPSVPAIDQGWPDPVYRSEPEPFYCDCSLLAPAHVGQIGAQNCSWYGDAYNWVRHTENLITSHKNNANYTLSMIQPLIDMWTKREALVRKHKRTALTMQAAGYKGSQHPRTVERVKTERDKLI